MPTPPATQRFILHKLLSLPSPILRLMSGGGVVYQGGRTLDPRMQFIASGARSQPPIISLPVDEARRSSAEAIALMTGAPEPGVRWEPLSIPRPDPGLSGDSVIPARVYRPAEQDYETPLIIYGHMGGGVLGDLETAHVFCTLLASIARAPVISVEYRLAPEHRFPDGLDDMMAAYHWGRENAERFGAPAAQAAIGGDSMGGNFAAIICQDLKAAGEPQPALQLLIYPCVDMANEAPSMTTYADAFPLNTPMTHYFTGQYIRPGDSPTDPRCSPLRGEDLSGLAPAIVITAGFDPFQDQGEAYARRLKDAGVPTAWRCYDSLAHGFCSFTGAVPAADTACREIAGLAREGFEGRIA